MKRYDLVIIGGGVAGLVSASGAAQLGAKVALIDRRALGGDCLHYGCVPTKRLVESARAASIVRRAHEFGVSTGQVSVDFKKVMERMREAQAKVGRRDAPERFREMGVDVYTGASGAFKDSSVFVVNDEELHGRRFIIATGSSPVLLPIPGLKEAGALTNEGALRLEELPRSIGILGAGPIGLEFAEVFARLGSKVTVVEKADRILAREDAEVSSVLHKALVDEGVELNLSVDVKEIRMVGKARVMVTSANGAERTHEVDEVMAAIGRAPNVDGLNLEAAGVEYDKRKGIKTDDTLRTSQAHIYACGDVVGPYAFTHVAEYHAGIALANALFPFVRRKVDYRVVPWVTFTDPELARVGLTEDEAKERHGPARVKVYRFDFKEVDRAILEGEDRGLIKLVSDSKGQILGAHIVGPRAGELIHEYVLAMHAGVTVAEISKTMHVYPTLSLSVKRAADQYYREKLFTGWFPKLAARIIHRGR